MWKSQLSSLSDTRSYLIIKECLSLEKYLTVVNITKYRVALSRFRLSSHMFMIERGRWSNLKLPVDQRLCNNCQNDIEDEYHVLLICPLFVNFRRLYLPRYYYSPPSMYKFIQLMNNPCHHIIINLSKCVYHIMNTYKR